MKKSNVDSMKGMPTTDTKMCVFCNGKELATLSVTGMGFPMGDKCYKKAIKRNVDWNEDTSLKDLKHLLRKRPEG